MATLNAFEVAAGSACGRHHALAGRPSQDAWHVEQASGAWVVVVADGCGSARYSEIGARIGARLFSAAVGRHVARGRSPAGGDLWERASRDVVRRLAALAHAMGGDPREVVAEHLLFTLVGAVLTDAVTVVFSIGDGLYAIDGEPREIGPFPGNAPPYLGHALLPGGSTPSVALHAVVPTASVRRLLVGTDGALPLGEALGGFDALWETDLFYENRDALRRRLQRFAESKSRIDWDARRVCTDPAVLTDDATLVALRRRPT